MAIDCSGRDFWQLKDRTLLDTAVVDKYVNLYGEDPGSKPLWSPVKPRESRRLHHQVVLRMFSEEHEFCVLP